jgi:hypothetical protein
MKAITFILFFLTHLSTLVAQSVPGNNIVVAAGNMPNMATDAKNNVHIVYGKGDSIMYVSSTNAGRSFSRPSLVSVLPGLFAAAMRGPQIAVADKGIIITACTKMGNIYAYRQHGSGWVKTKLNDADDVAKEALMGLAADGQNLFAVWLAVKKPRGQNVYGAESKDGGKTWKKNVLVYDSPDSTVCECCKPSVAVKGGQVYVMFRNQVEGNRDLYLATSLNGKEFSKVQKLGIGSWKLNACPMDGGGLVINKRGVPQTVWRREGKIYASTPGSAEKEIGLGRGCTVASVDNKNIYAWTENGEVVILKPKGEKNVLGKGSLPIVKAVNSKQCICIWEYDNQVLAAVVDL